MPRNSLGKIGLTQQNQKALEVVGNNIQTARKRRGWALESMAGSMMVTRKTLSRLEAGDSSVSLAVLAAALHVLNLTKSLTYIAAPDADDFGLFKARQQLPKRVRNKTINDDKLDF